MKYKCVSYDFYRKWNSTIPTFYNRTLNHKHEVYQYDYDKVTSKLWMLFYE